MSEWVSIAILNTPTGCFNARGNAQRDSCKEGTPMKKMTFLIAVSAGAGLLLAAQAHADEALAKQHNCHVCHQLDKKSVGPAYKEIAKKYKGQAGVGALLAEKVKKGGSGVWGPVPMAPNPAVPDADIRKLVDWIMKM